MVKKKRRKKRVRRKKRRKKGLVYRTKSDKYIHEVIKTTKEIKKRAKPYKPVYKYVKMGTHRVLMAFWGKKDSHGRHKYSTVQKILHKVGAKKPTKLLKIVGKIIKRGKTYRVRRTPKKRRVSVQSLRRLHKRITGKTSKNPCLLLANIPKVKIYDKITRIEAQKGKDSLYPNQKFYHNFSRNTKACIYGLPDGSLLIHGNKRLWKKIKQK